MRVLVVEDEAQLAEAVARGLRREGMAVDVAFDGDDGYRKASLTRYDVVVLDRDLPGMSGDEICRKLSDEGVLTRVIMLTASGTVEDKVSGLALGADDYLAKPFAFVELVARVRALGRRTTPAAPPVLTAGDIELDSAKRTVTRDGELIDLTRKEFGVLETLLMAQGSVVSSEELLDRVWDENADPFTTTVRVTMMTLRRKLGEPAIIDTVVGSGYRIDPAALATGRRSRRVRARVKLFRSTLRVRMALLYGGLVLLVGVSLLFTSLVLLDRAISGVQFFKFPGYVTAHADRAARRCSSSRPQLGPAGARPVARLPAAHRADLLRHHRDHRRVGWLPARQAGAAPDRPGHPDGPAALDRDARSADQPRRSRRRAARTGRHVRRDARPPGRGVRQPAAVRRQRQP